MLDLTKPVRTRDGREVRIYCTDVGGQYPVHGAIQAPAYGCQSPWLVAQWTQDGKIVRNGYNLADLVQAPREYKIHHLVDVYPSVHDGYAHIYVSDVRSTRPTQPIARILIDRTVTEGEGL